MILEPALLNAEEGKAEGEEIVTQADKGQGQLSHAPLLLPGRGQGHLSIAIGDQCDLR